MKRDSLEVVEIALEHLRQQRVQEFQSLLYVKLEAKPRPHVDNPTSRIFRGVTKNGKKWQVSLNLG